MTTLVVIARSSGASREHRMRLYNSGMPLLVLASVLFVTNLQAQPPAAQAAPDVVPHARAIVASLTAREFSKVEAEFDDKVKAALPPGRLEALWTGLLDQVGAYKSCSPDSRVVTIGDKQMVI